MPNNNAEEATKKFSLFLVVFSSCQNSIHLIAVYVCVKREYVELVWVHFSGALYDANKCFSWRSRSKWMSTRFSMNSHCRKRQLQSKYESNTYTHKRHSNTEYGIESMFSLIRNGMWYELSRARDYARDMVIRFVCVILMLKQFFDNKITKFSLKKCVWHGPTKRTNSIYRPVIIII